MTAEERATAIADKIVPAYRAKGSRYNCTGTIAKMWNAAYEGAHSAIATPPAPNDDLRAVSRFNLAWTAAPRPPVHPQPMTGRQSFQAFDEAVAFVGKQPSDSTFLSLTEVVTSRIDRSDDVRAALKENRRG